ncbi:MAG: methyltransferase domain-containing protein [Hyphomicrobiaceae bacterium]
MSTSGAETLASAMAQPRHTVAATYGNANSLPFQFRRKRFEHIKPLIEATIARKGACRIADIGGTAYYWSIFGDYVASRPIEIHLYNLEAAPTNNPKIKSFKGDATRLDDIADNSYDVVHANSVIEHVGTWDAMSRMSGHVRRIAPAYYVQTPNFWFPYEPHFRAPLFHWLPEQVRARLLMQFNLGFGGRRTSFDAAMRGVQSAVLIDRRQMRELFPDAEIRGERVVGLTKSLMAVRPAA